MQITASLTERDDGWVKAVQPRHVVLHLEGTQTRASLVAATEGQTRFVTAAPADARESGGGVDAALRRLSEQSGYPLACEDVHGVILSGPPLAMLVVGQAGAGDTEAIEHMRRLGIARPFTLPDVPPGNAARRPAWVQSVLGAWRSGSADVVVVVIPPGVLPTWAAQLLTTLCGVPASDKAPCMVISSDAMLAGMLPPSVPHLVRGPHLALSLIDVVARMVCDRAGLAIPERARVLFRTQALVAAIHAAQRARRSEIVYLDCSTGGMVITAREERVTIAHRPALDCGQGAGAVLRQCGADQIGRWLTTRPDGTALRQWALKRMLQPAAILTDPADRALAGAFVRAAMSFIFAKTGHRLADETLCILGPSWLQWGAPDAAMRAVADLLPLPRALPVALDPDDLLAVVGFLAIAHPESVASLLEHDTMAMLGTIVPVTQTSDRRAGRLTAEFAMGTTHTAVTVTPNHLTTCSCPEDATLRIVGNDGERASLHVIGGPCGVLLDARMRPLTNSSEAGEVVSVSTRLRTAPRLGEN